MTMILNSELTRLVFTLILMSVFIAMFVYFRGERKKIRELQKYYSNVKEDGFQYSTNDGPDPCKNDAEIETCEIRGMSGTMLLDEKGYV